MSNSTLSIFEFGISSPDCRTPPQRPCPEPSIFDILVNKYKYTPPFPTGILSIAILSFAIKSERGREQYVRDQENGRGHAMVSPRGTGKASQGRRRRELVLIEDPKSRLVTFSKRKSGLLKKASELSLLCGARVAAVVFSATGKPSAVGAPSVERVISRFAPLPSGEGDDDREREVMEVTARRAKETGARVAEEKTRMDAVGEKVLRAAAAGGVRFWWQADAEALGEEELREFARKLRRLRDNVRRRADKLHLAPAASQPTTALQ
jgi:hypothetical protein